VDENTAIDKLQEYAKLGLSHNLHDRTLAKEWADIVRAAITKPDVEADACPLCGSFNIVPHCMSCNSFNWDKPLN